MSYQYFSQKMLQFAFVEHLNHPETRPGISFLDNIIIIFIIIIIIVVVVVVIIIIIIIIIITGC